MRWIFVFLMLVFGLTSLAFAEIVPVLDQQQVEKNGGLFVGASPYPALCQTFTAGVTGNLTKISLYLATGFPMPDPINPGMQDPNYPNGYPDQQYPATISILGTSGGDHAPNESNVLWTKSFATLSQGWFDIDTSVLAPSLIQGAVYGIKIWTDDDDTPEDYHDDIWNLQTATVDPYASGKLWQNVGGAGWTPVVHVYPFTDAGFKTYMTSVPEPGTMVMVFLASLAIFARRIWRRSFP